MGHNLNDWEQETHLRIAKTFPEPTARKLQDTVTQFLRSLDFTVSDQETVIRVKPDVDVYNLLEPIAELTTENRKKLMAILYGNGTVRAILPHLLEEHVLAEDIGPIERDVAHAMHLESDTERSTVIEEFGQKMMGQEGRAAIKPLGLAVRFCNENGPRMPEGGLIPFPAMNERCRIDASAMEFVDELTPLLEAASVPLARVWQSDYCPRSADATNGGNGTLSPGDIADVRSFLGYLLTGTLALEKLVTSANPKFHQGTLTSVTAGKSIYSSMEATFFAFMRRRFPALWLTFEGDDGGEQYKQHRLKKSDAWKYFNQALSHTHELMRQKKEDFPQSNNFHQMEMYYFVLCKQLFNLAQIQSLTDQFKTPKKTFRRDTLSDEPLKASPNIMVIGSRKWKTGKGKGTIHKSQACVTTRFPTITHNIQTTLHICDTTKRETKHAKATITLHRPDGHACLSSETTNGLKSLFQPEHPTVIFGQGMENRTDENFLGLKSALEDLQIQKLLDMGNTIEEIVLVYGQQSNLRKLWGWGREYELHYSYFLLPRKGAEAMDILDQCRSLKKKEREFLEQYEAWIPEDPVVLPHYSDEDDGGGDEPPTPNPKPEPSRKCEFVHS